MKRISTFFLKSLHALATVVLLSAAGAAVAAEDTSDRLAKLQQSAAEMKQRLNLTPEQERQMAPVVEQGKAQRRAIFEKYPLDGGAQSLSFGQKRSLVKEMRAVREATNEQLATILSDSQMEEYQKIQDEQKQKLREFLSSRKQ